LQDGLESAQATTETAKEGGESNVPLPLYFPAQRGDLRIEVFEVMDMAKVIAVGCLCAVCLLSGCQVVRACPPVNGTVVDAVTRAPIKSAEVTIRYFNSEQVSQTDSQGRFHFEANHTLLVWLPPMDPVFGFSMQAKAEGYSTSDTMNCLWMSFEPPPEIPVSPSDAPKIVYADRVLVVDPITLAPISANSPAQRRMGE
jgi:hypothetical protein